MTLKERINNAQIVAISLKHKDNEENRLNLIPFARELLNTHLQLIIDDLAQLELQKEGAERTKKDIIEYLREQMKG